MYSTAGTATRLGALPRQITPPSWLRNLVGSVIRGTSVTVPTPAGSQTFDLGNPSHVAFLRSMASGASLSVTRKPPAADTPAGKINEAVQNVPGGWVTIAGGIVGLFFLAKMLGGRR